MRVHIEPEQLEQVIRNSPEKFYFEKVSALFGRKPTDVPEMFQAMALVPYILNSFLSMARAFYSNSVVDRLLKEKIMLVVSKINGCGFCIASHSKTLRRLGLSDADFKNLDALENIPARELVALEYAIQLTRDAKQVSDEMFARLKTHFNDQEIVELTFTVGLINFLNIFNNALQTEYLPDRPAM